MVDPIDVIDPETLAIQQQYSPSSQAVQLEIDKWVRAANLNLQVVKCLISPNKDTLFCSLEDDSKGRSFLSLTLLSWEANTWKGTYARLHPYKIPYSIHGFYTPSTPLKSYLTTNELPPLFIQLNDYLTRKYLAPQKPKLSLRKRIVSVTRVNAAWVPGMDNISTNLRCELTKTYPDVPRGSVLGRRMQKKVGRRKFVLSLVDTLRLRPVGNGTMIEQDFILEFDMGRISIPLARNTTFNIVAFIINQTWRLLSEIEKQGISPGIEKFLGENRFKCQWCCFGAAAITKLDTDPKFVYPYPVFEAHIVCPKCHEKSLAIFSTKETDIQQDARRRLLMCEKCGKEGLQIVGRKTGLGQGLKIKVHCPSCNNDAIRFLLRSFPL